MSCDFESEDLCGWSQDPMHDYDWRRKSAGSPTAEVGGPPFDKTFEMNGTGKKNMGKIFGLGVVQRVK